MTDFLGPEWHISAAGANIITANGIVKDKQKALEIALNTDLKEICAPVLPNELSKDKTSKIVLQIQKIRNISAPKANEESQAAPRLLKLSLSDGDHYVQALEITPINSISRNQTPPGSKVLINSAKVSSGYLLISPNTCTLLGGKVPTLVEKWEIAKSVQRNHRGNSTEDGPPPWVSFGTKIQSGNQDSNFKSLGNKSKDANKENSEFELQRQGAIAEASSGAIKKIFGGRVKQNVQPLSSQKPFEKKEQSRSKAKIALKEKEFEEKPQKPSGKVSLFSFLEDKLPLTETPVAALKKETSNEQKPVTSNAFNTTKNETVPKTNNQYFNDNQSNRNMKQTTTSTSKPYKEYPKPGNDFSNNRFDNSNQTGYTPKPRYNNYQKPDRQNNQNNFNKQFEKPQLPPPKQNFNNNQYSNSINNQFSHNTQRQPYKRNFDQTELKPTENRNFNTQGNKDVNETMHQMEKISLNSQFASRSLRQHLNLGPPKRNEDIAYRKNGPHSFDWNVGDTCLAKYWEDGKFYNAEVLGVCDRTVVVKFRGYGNIEEVLRSDCLAGMPDGNRQNSQAQSNKKYEQNDRPQSGYMEFRRSARNYN